MKSDEIQKAAIGNGGLQSIDSLENQQNKDVSKLELIGTNFKLGLAELALKTNPTISTAWLGLISAMALAEIDVKPAGANGNVVSFVKNALFKRADRRFCDYYSDLLKALIYGVAPFEITFKYREGRWWLKDLNFIKPRFFDPYTLRKNPGEWWVTGRCFVNDAPVKIGAPCSGLPVVWWPVYGAGLFGDSIIAPILDNHREKNYIEYLRRIGLNKSILGTICALQGDTMDGVTLSPESRDGLAYDLAHAAGEGQNNAVVLPPQVKQILPIYPAADSIEKSIAAEDHIDLQILQAFGSQHLARGLLSAYGSQGAGETDSKAQQTLRDYFFQWVARQFQDIIDFLVDLNFGPQTFYPELSIVSPAPQTTDGLIRSIVQLVGCNGLTLTENDESFLRRLVRMPPKSGKVKATDNEIKAPRVPGFYDDKTGMDTRDRTFEKIEQRSV